MGSLISRLVRGCAVYFEGDKNVLEQDRGDGCTTL